MEISSYVLNVFPTLILWIFVVGIALIWYLRYKYSYWKRAGVPYVSFYKIVRDMNKEPLHEVELLLYKKYGKIYGYYEGLAPCLTIAEPDIVKNIFIKDFHIFTCRRTVNVADPVLQMMLANLQGKDWKRVRSVVTPALSTGKIKKMTSIFIDSAKTLTDNFKIAAKEGKGVDMERLFGAFSLDVIASSAFATKLNSHNDLENPFVIAMNRFLTQSKTWRLLMYLFFPALSRFLKLSLFCPGTTEFFGKVALQMVEEKMKSKEKRTDFLQLMIDAVEKGMIEEEDSFPNDEAGQMAHTEGNEQISKQQLNLKSLSTAELVSQCFSFFLAGYNNIMLTLAFTAYELALHTDVQDKLIAEIDRIVGEQGELDYEAVSKMKYLDNVVSETLRKYPTATRIERRAEEDYYIEEHNLTVPKGVLIGIPVYAIHHDPEYFPDPEKYDPDRFCQEQMSSRHPYTYIPFGAGPRNCVAMRFALMEIKVCLAYVLSQCRFRTCDETLIPMEFIRNFIVFQPKKIMLKLEIRTDKV